MMERYGWNVGSDATVDRVAACTEMTAGGVFSLLNPGMRGLNVSGAVPAGEPGFGEAVPRRGA